MYPLAKITLENAERMGTVGSVTGPVVRGDTGTVEAHLKALARQAPEVAPLYQALALASLPLAQERGVAAGHAGADGYIIPEVGIMARVTVRELARMKAKGERIPMLTAYDYTAARLADEAGIPILLVGDSLDHPGNNGRYGASHQDGGARGAEGPCSRRYTLNVLPYQQLAGSYKRCPAGPGRRRPIGQERLLKGPG